MCIHMILRLYFCLFSSHVTCRLSFSLATFRNNLAVLDVIRMRRLPAKCPVHVWMRFAPKIHCLAPLSLSSFKFVKF